jgi:stage II sporulation protein R
MLKKVLGIIIILVGVLTGGFVVAKQGVPLEQSVLRLHVIANSDDLADQALKMAVKDDIVAMMKQEFSTINELGAARKLAEQSIPSITAVAESRIKASGYDYPVQVTVGEYDFPTKSYGDLVFPSGRYQAVRVVIGDGQGKNWWCVLFPPLCLVSSTGKGLSLDSPQQAQVTFKCLELLPKGLKLGKQQ